MIFLVTVIMIALTMYCSLKYRKVSKELVELEKRVFLSDSPPWYTETRIQYLEKRSSELMTLSFALSLVTVIIAVNV